MPLPDAPRAPGWYLTLTHVTADAMSTDSVTTRRILSDEQLNLAGSGAKLAEGKILALITLELYEEMKPFL